MHYDTIEEAYHFVNGAKSGERRALLHRPSGRVYYTSTTADYGELPTDAETSGDYLAVPHKSALPLGRELALDFVQEHCPRQMARVTGLFERKAAYRQFKEFLTGAGLLEEWYLYEEARERAALQSWCREQDLGLV